MSEMVTSISGDINPQSASPLFNRTPAEVRNHIFELALTSFDDKARPCKKGTFYYRPGFRYAQKIDTTLLLTCRRIFIETGDLPASINEYTFWNYRAPPNATDRDHHKMKRRPGLETLHLFTQQCWLESDFGSFTRNWDSKFSNVTCLKITLRHSDWWWWERKASIALDPKCRGTASARYPPVQPSEPFRPHSWGAQFENIKGLKKFQLELETVEQKKLELDAIVSRAPGWRVPLGDGRLLVLDESKTTRTGWVGHQLTNRGDKQEFDDVMEKDAGLHESDNAGQVSTSAPSSSTSTTALSTAKKRLVAHGVKFIEEHLEPRLSEDEMLTYYVVTLTWCAQ